MPNKNSPQHISSIPADDSKRALAIANSDDDGKRPHIGVVGDTYTILLSGRDTAGQFCLIDMYVPPGGGPPPHRHDFEETFSLLEGELDVIFRGARQVIRAGQTVNIPANAPHQFHNSSPRPGKNALHLFSRRSGRFFSRDRNSSRNPHHRSAAARPCRAS